MQDFYFNWNKMLFIMIKAMFDKVKLLAYNKYASCTNTIPARYAPIRIGRVSGD